jgi:hypothetical protein
MSFNFRFLRTSLCAIAGLVLVFGSPLPLKAIPPNPPAVGTPQNFSGLTLIAPVDLNRISGGPKTIDCESLYEGKYNGIQINVAMADYAGDPSLNLEKAIDDYVKTISKMSGVTEVDRSQRGVNMEGGAAQRLSLNITRADKILRAQVLFVVRGQRVWSVQTIYPNTITEGDLTASTIIDSVRLKPGTQTAALT